jgi:hypothetical protein
MESNSNTVAIPIKDKERNNIILLPDSELDIKRFGHTITLSKY